MRILLVARVIVWTIFASRLLPVVCRELWELRHELYFSACLWLVLGRKQWRSLFHVTLRSRGWLTAGVTESMIPRLSAKLYSLTLRLQPEPPWHNFD